MEFTPQFTTLENQRVEPAYITLLKDLFNYPTSIFRLHQNINKIKLERGTKQGDNFSPSLFSYCLQDAVPIKVNYLNKSINIDDELLCHLNIADGIILIAHTPQELEEIHNAIYTDPTSGPNMHLGKTSVIFNIHTKPLPVIANVNTIKEVDSYVYLGKRWCFCKSKEGLCLAGRLLEMRSSKSTIEIKRELSNECILPVMTYGSETLVLNTTTKRLLQWPKENWNESSTASTYVTRFDNRLE